MKAGVELKIERLGIRKQILYLVLACTILSLIVVGIISLFGIYKIKTRAVNIGVEIGESAAENSSQALKEMAMNTSQILVRERAKQINTFFKDLMWDVTAMSNEMTKILQNPQEYSPRMVYPPDWANAGKLSVQLQYRADVYPYQLDYEVGLTANLQDFQIMMFEGDNTIGANYVASVSGFNITVDRDSNLRVDEYNYPVANDYSTRPWYQNAMREGKTTLTDVFLDAHGRGLAMGCSAPYYGYYGEIAGVVGEGKFLTTVNDIVNGTKWGETGFAFIMNKNGNVIFSPRKEGELEIDYNENLMYDPSLFDSENLELAAIAQKMANGESGMDLVTIDGVPHYLTYTPLESTGWSFGVCIEEAEVVSNARANSAVIAASTNSFIDMLNDFILYLFLATSAVVLGIMIFIPFAARKVADKLTAPINQLTDGVREIASGNLDKKLDIHTGNEIEHLAVCFNSMTDELKRQMSNLEKVTADKERIATELNVATNIQLSMLPRDFNFNRNDFEIFATMNAAKSVGGDFYDFYLLDENHLLITIADVSGKGVPAALFMARSKTVLQNFATMMKNPDDFGAVMANANNQLCQSNDEMMFVTVFMAMLDLETGKLIFVNGGHNPPMIYRKATGKFEYLEVEQNCVLGMMDEMDFVQQEIQLESGDVIYLYTDGVTEAMDIDNNQYGEPRLSKCLNDVDKNSALEDILSAVRADIANHVKDAPQSDDITMLAVRLKN